MFSLTFAFICKKIPLLYFTVSLFRYYFRLNLSSFVVVKKDIKKIQESEDLKKNRSLYMSIVTKSTLVIVLAETRAAELTFDSFRTNVLETLQADLCLCIGVTDKYDKKNPFYQFAKYRFLFPEPADFGIAFDYAQKRILNASLPESPQDHERSDDEKVQELRDQLAEKADLTAPWRAFLRIPDQWLGGVRDTSYQHPGSAGILIFFRWFLLDQLQQHHLLDQYDRFVITRSDYMWRLPHPSLDRVLQPAECIWIPDEEHYGGYTDRHVVLSRSNVIPYLDIFHEMIQNQTRMMSLMKTYNETGSYNLESVIAMHLEAHGVRSLIRQFPYVMYAVRAVDGSTRWSQGRFDATLGMFIKYDSEFNKSKAYHDIFEHGRRIRKTDLTNDKDTDSMLLDEFYRYFSKHPLLRTRHDANRPSPPLHRSGFSMKTMKFL